MLQNADSLFKQHKYTEAAKIYFELAETSKDHTQKALLYRKAVDAYHELGFYDEEAKCHLNLYKILEGEEKINCIVSAWRTYIMAIVVFQYETGFEWKGEDENLHGSYEETIVEYSEKAVAILKMALQQRDMDKNKLLEKLGNECVNRQNEGEWGVDHCWKTIDSAWRK